MAAPISSNSVMYANFAGGWYTYDGEFYGLGQWIVAAGGTFTSPSIIRTYINAQGLLAYTAGMNTPRITYNPTTLLCEGLLLEGESTNLLVQSQFASGWTPNNATITPNALTAPDGTTTAIFLAEDMTNNQHKLTQSVSDTIGNVYTTSVYAKAGTRDYLWINLQSGIALFNLSTGVVVSSSGEVSVSITAAGNGWYRCAATCPVSSSLLTYGISVDGVSLSYLGGGSSYGIYLWGAQVEELPFASSYIPTTSSAVTRAAESLTLPWSFLTATFLLNTLGVNESGPNANAALITNSAAPTDTPLFYGGSGQGSNQVGARNYPEEIQLLCNFTGSFSGAVSAAVSGSPSSRALTANGATPTTDAGPLFGTTPNGLGLFESPELYGVIQQVGAWDFAATSTQLQTLSTPVTPPIPPVLTQQGGTFPPSGPTTLTTLALPAYPYQEYADDDDIQALFAAYNIIVLQIINWFVQIGLPVYTGPLIVDALLDWVAESIYGMVRPALSSGQNLDKGPLNTYAYDTLPLNHRKLIGPNNVVVTSDDIFKRVITWNFYKGDGNTFNIRWLKRRIMRFLNGPNGTAPNIDQTYIVSVTYGSGIIAIRIAYGTRTIEGGAFYNRTGFNKTAYNSLITVFNSGPSPPAYVNVLEQALESGALILPFQYEFSIGVG